MITDWFPRGTAPARDGCYIVRLPESNCQHFCRWDVETGLWYSAGSEGQSKYERIGWESGADIFEWRGLAQEPNQ